LLLIQFTRVIDADRRRGRGALERVFAGHWEITLVSRSALFNEKFRRDFEGVPNEIPRREEAPGLPLGQREI
jgi:hypothetical protein